MSEKKQKKKYGEKWSASETAESGPIDPVQPAAPLTQGTSCTVAVWNLSFLPLWKSEFHWVCLVITESDRLLLKAGFGHVWGGNWGQNGHGGVAELRSQEKLEFRQPLRVETPKRNVSIWHLRSENRNFQFLPKSVQAGATCESCFFSKVQRSREFDRLQSRVLTSEAG